MKILYFLADTFVTVFGITRPGPDQRKLVALGLGGGLLFAAIALAALLAWLLLGTGR